MKRLTSASHFSRLSIEERKKIIDSALEYKGSGRTLNDVALQIANETGRGHETIRGLLQSDARANESLHHSPPLSKFDARVIDRARRIGISWETLTHRYDRTVDALRKAVARQRATKLKQLKINYVELEVFSRDDAEEVILGAPVILNLMPPLLSIDVFVNANGGGYTGQAGAILLGLGRALAKYDPSLDGILRSNGFLSRDPRRVERKKPGQPGARKRFQFSKR